MQTVVEERKMPMEFHDAQFKRIDERLAEVDRRITETAKATDLRLKELDRRITKGNEQTARQFKELDRRITESKEDSNRRFDGVNEQFKEVNRRIDDNTSELKSFRQEIQAFHSTFQRGNYTLVATIVGAIMVLVIKGG